MIYSTTYDELLLSVQTFELVVAMEVGLIVGVNGYAPGLTSIRKHCPVSWRARPLTNDHSFNLEVMFRIDRWSLISFHIAVS